MFSVRKLFFWHFTSVCKKKKTLNILNLNHEYTNFYKKLIFGPKLAALEGQSWHRVNLEKIQFCAFCGFFTLNLNCSTTTDIANLTLCLWFPGAVANFIKSRFGKNLAALEGQSWHRVNLENIQFCAFFTLNLICSNTTVLANLTLCLRFSGTVANKKIKIWLN